MIPILSSAGERMNKLTGVRAIMKDILQTLSQAGAQKFINLSPGNPIILPEVESMWRELSRELLDSKEFGPVICRYGASQGYEPLIEAVVTDFNKRYDLKLNSSNVLITPGSQALYFYAANAFGGIAPSGKHRKIVLPLCPDYTGYGGICIDTEAVISFKPVLDIEASKHRFKYKVDLAALTIDDSSGCVLFSRPCNPTGNVLTETEVDQISVKARKFKIPVFVDSAYGSPFPALHFTECKPRFEWPLVHCMSLSKAGLPGERIGIAIGDPQVIEALECFQSNACIHSPRYGQAIVAKAINTGRLIDLSNKVIRPFYLRKFELLENTLAQVLPSSIPWYLHRGEGAIFAWLWFDQLPCSDTELYQKLKKAGVLVVPGKPFFPGLKETWPHSEQCVRISLTASDQELVTGLGLLGNTIKSLYARQ